jgi:hypothetical protein
MQISSEPGMSHYSITSDAEELTLSRWELHGKCKSVVEIVGSRASVWRQVVYEVANNGTNFRFQKHQEVSEASSVERLFSREI